jgi:hypothetical protein
MRPQYHARTELKRARRSSRRRQYHGKKYPVTPRRRQQCPLKIGDGIRVVDYAIAARPGVVTIVDVTTAAKES